MKKYNLLIALFCGFVASTLAQQNQEFRIEGKTPASLNGKMIYLDYSSNGFQNSDSIRIDNGRFSFTGWVDEPVYARMVLDASNQGKIQAQYTGDRLYFYLGNEYYQLEIQDSLTNAQVLGSPLHDAYSLYLEEIGGCFMKLMDEAGKSFAQVDARSADAEANYAALKKKYDKRLADRRVKELEFAKANPNSLFALDALLDVANALPLHEVEPVFLKLDASIRKSQQGKALASRILAEKTIRIGTIAPDFVQPDVNGHAVRLSDFRGRYVLVDFWASWCSPCRAENPNLKKAYERYRAKGFAVVAISLDDNKGKDAWLKAIVDDGLTWINVADLKGWSNEVAVLYGVRSVPTNYLIDPNGQIIAKDLRGDNLHKVLGDLFEKAL